MNLARPNFHYTISPAILSSKICKNFSQILIPKLVKFYQFTNLKIFVIINISKEQRRLQRTEKTYNVRTRQTLAVNSKKFEILKKFIDNLIKM